MKNLLLRRKKAGADYVLTKRSVAQKILFFIVGIFFVLYAVSILFPVFWLLMNSLKDSTEYALQLANFDPFALPENMSTLVGYCMSKYNFRGKGFLYGVIIFSISVPFVGSGGAYFKLIRDLNLYDTPLYAFITSIYGFSANFLIAYAVFKNISWNYAEAVFIDGGGHYTVFFRIMLPQAMPVVGTMIITAVITAWNDYSNVLLYLPSFPTVASGLYLLSLTFVRFGGQTLYYTGIIISILPMAIIFVIFSNSLMQNMTVGGLKG